jgi:hypothetical protein
MRGPHGTIEARTRAEQLTAPDIAGALEQDAAGRMDAMDQALLAAIRTDLGGAD